MREISENSYRENQNARLMFNNFFERRAIYEIMVEKYGRGRQTT
jgi:hypothetical protein